MDVQPKELSLDELKQTKKLATAKGAEYARKFREKNPGKYIDYQRRYDLKKFYGISPEEYQILLIAQNGVCAICSKKTDNGKRLSVDHSHTSGKVRGLLCSKCNFAVGLLNDETIRAKSLLDYLIKYE